MFPGFRLALPPKRWFKDNYNPDFLEDRQLGLQAFLQNLVAHKDIANWYVIKFCLGLGIFLCSKPSYRLLGSSGMSLNNVVRRDFINTHVVHLVIV